MTEDNQSRPEISWARAFVVVAATTVFGVLVLVYGSNLILTHVHRLKRGAAVAIVTVGFLVVLIAMAWVLRVLQRRNVI
jgi:hypothetical protein